MGLFDKLKGKNKEKTQEAAMEQNLQSEIELSRINQEVVDGFKNIPETLPEECNGQKKKYHYQAVQCGHHWVYSGRYGEKKTLFDLGMTSGEPLSISIEDYNGSETVILIYGNQKIGYIVSDGLSRMVKQWAEAGKPVRAAVTGVSPKNGLYIELAFYGYVPKKKTD